MADRADWYTVAGGRRHVIPYSHEFSCFAKGRWVGRTLTDVLTDEFPDEFSDASAVVTSAAAGRLLINGSIANPQATFAHGDKFTHHVERQEPSVPADPLQLLVTADDLLVINKPAGMPVHHAGRYRRNTLVEILRSEHPEFALRGGDRDGLHVLHRLDRQVSGVLLLPRTSPAAATLNEALREGRMRKRYLARVHGEMPISVSRSTIAAGVASVTGAAGDDGGDSYFVVTAPIFVSSANGATVTTCDERGKPATTIVRCLAYDRASHTSLVLCEPITGRSHQIRLHLQRVGHPVANDTLYPPLASDVGCTAAGKRQKVAAEARPTNEDAEGEDGAAEGEEGAGQGRSRPGSGDADELWLHAWAYSCEGGGRPFSAVAPPPPWSSMVFPHEQLPELTGIDVATAPIPLDSTEGRRMLESCDATDRIMYDRLWPHFRPQVNRTYCGLATIANVLRADEDALQPTEYTGEDDVADRLTPTTVNTIRKKGLTLSEMSEEVLRRIGLPHHIVWARGNAQAPAAGDSVLAQEEINAAHDGIARLRDALRACRVATADRPITAVLVNYHMSTAGQRPFGGHFSPLAAFHAPSGRFLVLDVWPDTGPCWIHGAFLWAAMASTDPDSGRSRGWIEMG